MLSLQLTEFASNRLFIGYWISL